MSFCQYLHILHVLHMPILWSKMGGGMSVNSVVVSVYTSVGVNTS